MFYCAERVPAAAAGTAHRARPAASISRLGGGATGLATRTSQATPAALILQSLRGHVCLSELAVAMRPRRRPRSSVGRSTRQQGVEEEDL